MALTKIKLGKLITLSEDKNSDNIYGIDDVKGISIQKRFIETKADMEGVSLRPYLLVKPDDFAYVTVTSRNGEKITLAHNTTDDTYIVSSSYVVFRVARKDALLSDYLFMFFNRPEFDRYSRFNSWGSARETFSWDEMCDIELELPPIEIQRKYVEIYKGMVDNQIAYETGLEDLKLVCDGFIEDLRNKNTCEVIASYIEETRIKNFDGEKLKNRAVSNTKVFVDAKDAVVSGVESSNYVIVNEREFAYNTVTTRNADKLSIAFNNGERCLVSPLYTTFRVCSDKLLPEYLCLWFNRVEYDRYARFNSWGSARELFSFETLSQTMIPIPEMSVQQAIVDIYNAYMLRKKINEQLKQQIKIICPILIKGAVEEAKRSWEV